MAGKVSPMPGKGRFTGIFQVVTEWLRTGRKVFGLIETEAGSHDFSEVVLEGRICLSQSRPGILSKQGRLCSTILLQQDCRAEDSG